MFPLWKMGNKGLSMTPPITISKEAREAAFSEIIRYNHHQGVNQDRGCYVQELLNQSSIAKDERIRELEEQREQFKQVAESRECLAIAEKARAEDFQSRYSTLLSDARGLVANISKEVSSHSAWTNSPSFESAIYKAIDSFNSKHCVPCQEAPQSDSDSAPSQDATRHGKASQNES